VKIASLVLVIWLVIGAIAAGRRRSWRSTTRGRSSTRTAGSCMTGWPEPGSLAPPNGRRKTTPTIRVGDGRHAVGDSGNRRLRNGRADSRHGGGLAVSLPAFP